MAIKWYKIDWDKLVRIENSLLTIENGEVVGDDSKFWKYMQDQSGMKMRNGGMPRKFRWEHGYKVGLPLEDGKKYLVYFEKDNYFDVAEYDEEQDYSPCFWTLERDPEPSNPDFWAELERPK